MLDQIAILTKEVLESFMEDKQEGAWTMMQQRTNNKKRPLMWSIALLLLMSTIISPINPVSALYYSEYVE